MRNINPIQWLSRYSIKTDTKGKYFRVEIPKEVIEKEARKLGLDNETFLKDFEMEALYGSSFEGIHYRFVSKEPKPKLKE